MQELGDLWLNNVESGVWRAFLSVHSRLMTALNDELIERTGLSLAEYEVLVHLSEAEQRSMRMNELAAKCSLTPSGLTRRFDTMIRTGYVTRERCGDDRRGVNAVLTAYGMERLEAAAPIHVAAVRDHFVTPLGVDGVEALSHALARISAVSEDEMDRSASTSTAPPNAVRSAS